MLSVKYIQWVSEKSKRGGFGGFWLKQFLVEILFSITLRTRTTITEFLEITDFEKLFLYGTGLLSSKNEINFTPKLRFFVLKTL